MTYFDIGHRRYNNDDNQPLSSLPEEELWIWCGDKLISRPAAYGVKHQDLAKDLGDDYLGMRSRCYKGRFGQYRGKKAVSVVHPNATNRLIGIPDALLKDLYTKYGVDIEVYEM